jgi:hypothetical protein
MDCPLWGLTLFRVKGGGWLCSLTCPGHDPVTIRQSGTSVDMLLRHHHLTLIWWVLAGLVTWHSHIFLVVVGHAGVIGGGRWVVGVVAIGNGGGAAVVGGRHGWWWLRNRVVGC